LAACSSEDAANTTVVGTTSEVAATATTTTAADPVAAWDPELASTLIELERGEVLGCADEIVAVHSGEVVSLGSQQLLTIARVFGQIEDAIRDGADVQVTYDDLGSPTVLTIDLDQDDVAEVDSDTPTSRRCRS
jgi:hypothetical protein